MVIMMYDDDNDGGGGGGDADDGADGADGADGDDDDDSGGNLVRNRVEPGLLRSPLNASLLWPQKENLLSRKSLVL